MVNWDLAQVGDRDKCAAGIDGIPNRVVDVRTVPLMGEYRAV